MNCVISGVFAYELAALIFTFEGISAQPRAKLYNAC